MTGPELDKILTVLRKHHVASAQIGDKVTKVQFFPPVLLPEKVAEGPPEERAPKADEPDVDAIQAELRGLSR